MVTVIGAVAALGDVEIERTAEPAALRVAASGER
jgi:hypothetical protein